MPWFAGPESDDCVWWRFGKVPIEPLDSAEFLRFKEQVRSPALANTGTSAKGGRKYLVMDLSEGAFYTVSIIMNTDSTTLSDVLFEAVDGW